MSYIGYISVGLGILLFAFLAGYFFGSRQPVVPDHPDFKDELGFLEVEIAKAKKTLDVLLKRARLTRQDKPHQSPVVVRNDKDGLWQRTKGRFFGNPKRGDESGKSALNLVERLKRIKHDIKNIKAEIESVTHALDPGATRQHYQADAVSDSGSTKLHGVIENVFPEQIDFDSSREDALWDTTAPTIRRISNELGVEDADLSKQSTTTYSAPTAARKIVALYNLALTDPVAREEFRDQFAPLRVGVVNAVERSQNPRISPEFRETTDGDLFAFPISSDQYAVVPRLGLTIEAVTYGAGALGEVFNKTRGHDPKRFYSLYRVREPAIFKREGNCWELRSPGELDLGPGD